MTPAKRWAELIRAQPVLRLLRHGAGAATDAARVSERGYLVLDQCEVNEVEALRLRDWLTEMFDPDLELEIERMACREVELDPLEVEPWTEDS